MLLAYFAGWTNAPDAETVSVYDEGENITLKKGDSDGDNVLTLYAVWTAKNVIRISLNADGNGNADKTVMYDGSEQSADLTVNVTVSSTDGTSETYAVTSDEESFDVTYNGMTITVSGLSITGGKGTDVGDYAVYLDTSDITVSVDDSDVSEQYMVVLDIEDTSDESSKSSISDTADESGDAAFIEKILSFGAVNVYADDETDEANDTTVVDSVIDTEDTDSDAFYGSVIGYLHVTKRDVILTSGSDSKTYDGLALTNSSVVASGTGFVDGQGVTTTVTGSQTDVGESENIFTYEANEGTDINNYDVSTVYGVLKVTTASSSGSGSSSGGSSGSSSSSVTVSSLMVPAILGTMVPTTNPTTPPITIMIRKNATQVLRSFLIVLIAV